MRLLPFIAPDASVLMAYMWTNRVPIALYGHGMAQWTLLLSTHQSGFSGRAEKRIKVSAAIRL